MHGFEVQTIAMPEISGVSLVKAHFGAYGVPTSLITSPANEENLFGKL